MRLAPVPDSTRVRVENCRVENVALLHLSDRDRGRKLEEHAEEGEEDDEEFGKDARGRGLRAHDDEEGVEGRGRYS